MGELRWRAAFRCGSRRARSGSWDRDGRWRASIPAGRRPGGWRAIARAWRSVRLGPARRRPGAPERGQALPLVLGAAFVTIFVALALAALGGAVTATERDQRAADLIALSAARSMRDDLPRLTAPARLPDGAEPGAPRPAEYLARAAAAAREAARRNGIGRGPIAVEFPDAASPCRSARASSSRRPRRAAARAARCGPRRRRRRRRPRAGRPPTASGGGYSGPLAYRQGKPMRPDVAAAFDRLAAAAARDGVVAGDHLRLPLRRRAGPPVRPEPRPPLGRAARHLAPPLRAPSSTSARAAAYGWLAANAAALRLR